MQEHQENKHKNIVIEVTVSQNRAIQFTISQNEILLFAPEFLTAHSLNEYLELLKNASRDAKYKDAINYLKLHPRAQRVPEELQDNEVFDALFAERGFITWINKRLMTKHGYNVAKNLSYLFEPIAGRVLDRLIRRRQCTLLFYFMIFMKTGSLQCNMLDAYLNHVFITNAKLNKLAFTRLCFIINQLKHICIDEEKQIISYAIPKEVLELNLEAINRINSCFLSSINSPHYVEYCKAAERLLLTHQAYTADSLGGQFGLSLTGETQHYPRDILKSLPEDLISIISDYTNDSTLFPKSAPKTFEEYLQWQVDTCKERIIFLNTTKQKIESRLIDTRPILYFSLLVIAITLTLGIMLANPFSIIISGVVAAMILCLPCLFARDKNDTATHLPYRLKEDLKTCGIDVDVKFHTVGDVIWGLYQQISIEEQNERLFKMQPKPATSQTGDSQRLTLN